MVAGRRDELLAYLRQRITQRNGPGALLFGTGPHAGKTLAQVAGERGLPFDEVLLDIGPGGGQAAHFVMDRALQDRLLQAPFVALGSDGAPGGSHPRSAGTFAKFIEQFVVKQPRLSIEEAVRKMTALPAAILGLTDRGRILPGYKADLVLFDPARVRARSTYVDPKAMAEGFDLVLVNGIPALEPGAPVTRGGRLLRHRP